jgi:hypothetical protein
MTRTSPGSTASAAAGRAVRMIMRPSPTPHTPQTDFTTTTGHTARSARPLPSDHSPSRRQARRTPSDGATGPAGCSTSISRSQDVCTVSGTHRLGQQPVECLAQSRVEARLRGCSPMTTAPKPAAAGRSVGSAVRGFAPSSLRPGCSTASGCAARAAASTPATRSARRTRCLPRWEPRHPPTARAASS